MTARPRRTVKAVVMVGAMALALGSFGRIARAGEEDDLQRQIETQRSGVAEATTDEITLLRAWLDEAWSLRSKHEYDEVREVLDRCLKQADLIRAKITASKLRAQAQKHEAALADLRAKISRTKKALQETTTKKRALEGSTQ